MNLHRLDLVSLSLLNTVVRTGSISKGAASAHLSIAAASKRISDLETAVGADLFERHSRGVILTLAGQALHRHAQKILSDVDQLAAELSDHAKGVVGVIRLWANTSAVTQFLPRELASFSRANSGIRFELHEANGDEIVRAVLEGRGDIGIFAENTPALGLHTMPYRDDRLVLVVPRGHELARRRRLAFAEVTDHDFVSLHQETSLADKLAHGALAGAIAAGSRALAQFRRHVPDGGGRPGHRGNARDRHHTFCGLSGPVHGVADRRLGRAPPADRGPGFLGAGAPGTQSGRPLVQRPVGRCSRSPNRLNGHFENGEGCLQHSRIPQCANAS